MYPEISNLTLDKLYESESLSEETLMFCQGFRLCDIQSIVQFYHLNGNLISQMKYIHPNQTKPTTELKKMYQKYHQYIQSYTIPLKHREDILFIGLTELMQRENLPEWLMSRCSDNDLNNLNSILEYYRKEKSFLTLKRCGPKVNEKLIELCQRFDDLEVEPVINPVEEALNSAGKLRESLSATQALAFENFINYKTEKLSCEGLKSLQRLQNCHFKKPDLPAILFFDDVQISSIYRIDVRTTTELMQLKKLLKEYVDLITVQKPDQNQYLHLLKTMLPQTDLLNDDKKAVFTGFDFSKGIPIFKTIDFLVENNVLWQKTDKFIFRNSNEFCREKRLDNIAEMAAELCRSKPFVNRITFKLFQKLDTTFSFLKFFDSTQLNLYDFDEHKNLFFVDDKLVTEINNAEGTHFSAQFITKIFSIVYSHSYQLIGRFNNCYYSREKEWTNCYLISLRQTSKVDIYDFVKYVGDLFSSDVIKTYTFSLANSLKSYTYSKVYQDEDLLDNIKFILAHEYGIELDKNYKSIIKKNINISVEEGVYELFKLHKRPLSINEICGYMYRTYQYQISKRNIDFLIKCLDNHSLLTGYIDENTQSKAWMLKTYS
jgi:hypothetical protein